ncbi:MAG: dicarboxylate/amino acid:cation symporter [Planctomycetota bacterium]|jgi:Na+/H+-dicarboxylate symporter
MKQHHWIFVSMIAGALIGLGLAGTDGEIAENFVWICDLVGNTVFVGSLKMLVAPLIFFSILAGITSLPSQGELWDIGWRTFAYYFATTAIAVTIGLFFVLTIQPGHMGPREELRESWPEHEKQIESEFAGKDEKVERAKDLTVKDQIKSNLKRIIENPFLALTESNSLGIIFFAILFGIALIMLHERAQPVVAVIGGVNAAIMMITGWIMRLAPIFIFCLIVALAAKQGANAFKALGWYVVTVIVAIAAHNVVLLVIVRFLGGRPIREFARGIRRAWAVAFATRSSAATLPVTLDCVENQLKVPKKVTDFVLPIGATINMDGTALYEGIAVIFLIQLYGGLPGTPTDVSAVMTGVIFVTAVLASIGAAAIPDAGLITMVLVASAVGLDVKYIGMLFAVDAFLDMFRTSTNVVGDSIGAVVIDRLTSRRRVPS